MQTQMVSSVSVEAITNDVGTRIIELLHLQCIQREFSQVNITARKRSWLLQIQKITKFRVERKRETRLVLEDDILYVMALVLTMFRLTRIDESTT
jgi:hypothetical protein